MTRGRPPSSEPATRTVSLDEGDREALLDVLGDPRSRAIVRAAADRTLTAAELSETLEMPLSTVYRKLDAIVETPLLEATCRCGSEGKHPEQYRCPVGAVRVDLSGSNRRVLHVDASDGPAATGDGPTGGPPSTAGVEDGRQPGRRAQVVEAVTGSGSPERLPGPRTVPVSGDADGDPAENDAFGADVAAVTAGEPDGAGDTEDPPSGGE